jgi:arginine decarboxylase
MLIKMPTCYFLVCGRGDGNSLLNSFDMALLDAGVGDTNLVRLSSIVPPNCKRIDPISLPLGALVPCAYSHISSDKPGAVISACVCAGIPHDPNQAGVIMEYSSYGTKEQVEQRTKQMVEDAFAFRNRKLKEIIPKSIQHRVETCGSAFAALVAWDVD